MRIGEYTLKGRIIQQPNENIRRLFNYSRWLEAGETLTSVTAAVTPVTSPPLVITNIVIDPDAGKKAAYYASGGVDGETYTATFTATTSIDQVREDEVQVAIREILRG